MAGMWSPTWVGERLREERVITASQLRLALQNMQLYNERMEEALLRVGALDEGRLLRFIAEKCRTHYVSTNKIAQIEVPADVLRRVPMRTAEKLLAFPVRYDDETATLTLVSPDAGDPEYVKQAAIALGVKSLKLYVARPAAVRAAIAKWYEGQIQAFAEIAPDTFTQIRTTNDLYERQLLDADGLTTKRSGAPAREREREYFKTPVPGVTSVEPGATSGAPRAPAEDAYGASRAPSGARISAISIPKAPPPTLELLTPQAAPSLPADRGRFPGTPDRRLLDLTEVLSVAVALSENTRDEFRGHSGSVARLSRTLAERIGLDELSITCAVFAGHLHDLGKTASYHLTALNVAEYATHRTAAQKLLHTPVRLLENIDLPEFVADAVGAMYERFDGQGVPGRLAAKDIPLSARILALSDTFSDLTLNPRNPFRKTLSNPEALEVLGRYRGSIFDPDLVDLLSQLVAGEDLRRRLGENQPLVLLVDPSPEETTLLELRLVAQGFEVKVARTSDQALALALDGGLHSILSEVELLPFDGFELLTRLRKYEQTQSLPFLFVARVSDTSAVDRAFSLGAQDYVIKPTSGDVLAGKLRRLAAPKSRRDDRTGVSGSLSEMGLPDLAQVIAHGRKNGRLLVRSQGREGEVHFLAGRVVHALVGELIGPDAFYELLAFTDGSFVLDPSFQPAEHTIESSHENLILEGLRRLDERNRNVV
jgi:response regulator RpfG family c-di-GMP phosphodiesterase